MDEQQSHDIIRGELDRQGVTDLVLRRGIPAIAMVEGGLTPRTELSYAHTSVDRLRQLFGTRISDLHDGQLDVLKQNDQLFFEKVYGGRYGNTSPGDGYKYRGRGWVQLTFKGNYVAMAEMIHRPDLIDNPDLANDPTVAAAILVAFIRSKYTGGGFEKIKSIVGNNTPDIDTRKNAMYAQFIKTGEFDVIGVVSPATVAGQPQYKADAEPVIAAFYRASFDLQTFLRSKGKYTGTLDSDFGPDSRSAFFAYLRSRG